MTLVSTLPRKLEIGCGRRPTPGYLHNDVNDFPDVDIVCPAWQLGATIEAESLDEVIALGVIEHLTCTDAKATFTNVFNMLTPGGRFFFDVPDLPVWCRYMADHWEGKPVPFTKEHVEATIYGWQRWPGDEHKSGWDHDLVESSMFNAGFTRVQFGVNLFLEHGLDRRRMHRPEDAHVYCVATK